MSRVTRARNSIPAGLAKRFGSLVEQTRNPRTALSQLRKQVSSTEILNLFEELSKNKFFVSAVAPDPYPRKFGRLGVANRLTHTDLANEVTWQAEAIRLFAPSLTVFVNLEKRFDAAYIKFETDVCLKVLDEVENAFGLSLWLISRRSQLLRRLGTPHSEEYVRHLLASDPHRGLMPYIVYMIGFRSDPNVTPANVVRSVQQTFADGKFTDELRHYVRRFVVNEPPQSEDACAAILSFGDRLPMVDRYTLLLDALQYLAASRLVLLQTREAAYAASTRLQEVIPDARTQRLHHLSQGPKGYVGVLAEVLVDEADAYTKGDYAGAQSQLGDQIARGVGTVTFLPLLARTYLRVGIDSPLLTAETNELARQIASEYAFEGNGDASSSALAREALTGGHRALTACLRSLFAARDEDPSQTTLEARIEALNVDRLTPTHLRNLPSADPVDLLSQAASLHPSSAALTLQQAILEFGASELPAALRDQLPEDRGMLYAARALRRLGRTVEAISLLTGLQHAPFGPVANDARRELFDAYVSTGDINEALRVVASAHLQNGRAYRIFKLPTLLAGIEQSTHQPFDQISLSICYYIYNRFNNDGLLGAQADAAEEYALSRGVDLPSMIAVDQTDRDRELLPLYLDKVCSAPVLDKFMVVDSTDQVEIERLEICRILSELDHINRQYYLEQIREITRRRIVRARFEQVERTKIYVDADGVKRQSEKTIKEGYQRFIAALSDASYSNDAIEMMRQVNTILSSVNADGVKIHFPDLPTNERDQIFSSCVRDLMRLLISSQEYGLEAYLSTRVRHGTMGNQLRSAFEINSILTQKDNGRYVADYMWAGNLNVTDYEAARWLAERLAAFSEAIDLAIEDLVRKRVQVRSDVTPEGLLEFNLFNYDILRMQAEVTLETDFEEFFDKVLDRFWTVLEDSLGSVRKFVNGPFLASVVELTEQLQLDVTHELAGYNVSALAGAIASARTQIAVNSANVANWFTLAREVERPDYEFGVAAEVAIGSIAACHPSLGLRLERNDDVNFECRGRSLESLVYILFTALDNAVEHCALGDAAPTLMLDTRLEDGWLSLRLVNSCAAVTDVETANRRLDGLRSRLGNSHDVQSLATTEGGSGYAKIVRMLRHDLLARYSLDFGFVNESEYEVKIGVEAKAVVR